MDKRFCPECGSENVSPDFRRTNVLGEAVFNQNKWLCDDCGFTGLMPEGEASEDIEFESVENEFDLVDGSAGRAYFDYWFYILIPATLLFILSLVLL